MKSVVTAGIILLFVLTGVEAQINPRVFGGRLEGGQSLVLAEASYQHALGDKNRLELDLGLGGNPLHTRLFLSGIYHWHWNIKSGFNWYLGPGGGVGLIHHKATTYLNFAVCGQVGIEYNFLIHGLPLLVSIDARPMWDILGDYAGLGVGTALGVRYVFK